MGKDGNQTMKEHEIKVWSEYWDALDSGEKNFEVRRDDRGYQKGDILVLAKYDRKRDLHFLEGNRFGADKIIIRREITYILTGGQLGIEPGFVVLGLKKA